MNTSLNITHPIKNSSRKDYKSYFVQFIPRTSRKVLNQIVGSIGIHSVAFPKQQTIAENTGLSLRTVNRCIALLSLRGCINVKQRWNKSAVYTLSPLLIENRSVLKRFLPNLSFCITVGLSLAPEPYVYPKETIIEEKFGVLIYDTKSSKKFSSLSSSRMVASNPTRVICNPMLVEYYHTSDIDWRNLDKTSAIDDNLSLNDILSQDSSPFIYKTSINADINLPLISNNKILKIKSDENNRKPKHIPFKEVLPSAEEIALLEVQCLNDSESYTEVPIDIPFIKIIWGMGTDLFNAAIKHLKN